MRSCQYFYDLLIISLATAPENQQILACISAVREKKIISIGFQAGTEQSQIYSDLLEI